MMQIALMATLALGLANKPVKVDWQTDYAKAAARAAKEQKPLAVFIEGKAPGKVVTEGTLTPEITQILTSSYVCVFIDAETVDGKKVAESFEMNQGLILSNRTGDKQALRHTGTVATTDLNRYLTEQAEPTLAAATTITGTTASPAPSRRAPIRNFLGAIADPFAPPCRT